MSATIVSGWSAFGAYRFGPGIGTSPSSLLRAERMAASPQMRDGRFVNEEAMRNDYGLMLRGLFNRSARSVPDAPLPVVTDAAASAPDAQQFEVTWYGHSSLRVRVAGLQILIDPMWGQRPSPLSFVGPSRWYDPPASLDALGSVDVVLISHDHYDHLDQPTIAALLGNPANRHTRFLVPLGVGAHLEHWGVAPDRIVELDWWESQAVGGVTFTATPARHASGRSLLDRDATLWAGWALSTATQRVYYSGDTGMMPAFEAIGEKLGPFDLTLMQVGAYDPAWPDWHLTPEQAVAAHRALRGTTLLPVHWGLFNLAYHAWDDPIARLTQAAEAQQLTLATPRPGEAVVVGGATHDVRWWRR
ncbi:MAG: MBL fold metallo-hydrolase [Gemmatimonadaceae bacterium]|nr:MBL fold metallo-hydrolase [Gemmatimonadaceae bacterium]